jgi:hypothetical protein
MNLLKRD